MKQGLAENCQVGNKMHLITHNPYRIIGIFSNASEKDIVRQKSLMQRYLEIGREPSSELDFKYLPKINRSKDLIEQAFSSIEKKEERLFHALFWFAQVTPIDAVIIGHMKNSEYEKSYSACERVVQGKYIDKNNLFSFINFSSIALLNKDWSLYQNSLITKFKIISNPILFDVFSVSVLGDSNVDSAKVKYIFLNHVHSELKKSNYSDEKIISFYKDLDPDFYNTLIKSSASKIVNQFDSLIKKSKNCRELDPNDISPIKSIIQLCEDSKFGLKKFSEIYPTSSLEYQNLVNDIAVEISEAAYAYFDYWYDKVDNIQSYSELSLDYVRKAKFLATSVRAIEKIDDCLNAITHRAENKEQEEILGPILKQLGNFSNKIKSGHNFSITEIEKFVSNCSPFLTQLTSNNKDQHSEEFNNLVAQLALSALIELVNKRQKNSDAISNETKNIFIRAHDLITNLLKLNVGYEIKQRLNGNQKTIRNLIEHIETELVWHTKKGSNSWGRIIFWAFVVFIILTALSNS